MTFRKDINCLRAIAVLAVAVFHFNKHWLPGGFAGVDVFFVISGFLMTRIIFEGIKNKSFSILSFYVARASRIIPALFVLCLVLLILGKFFLINSDYDLLIKHATKSIMFISNFTYWNESGYFDISSREKWLLHTWSLSVEWQFYMLYPLALILLSKATSITKIKFLLLLGTVASFVYCIGVTYKFPNLAYYLLPSRMWEMMLGGLAYTYPLKIKKKYKTHIQQLGLIFIFTSFFFVSKDTPWPGYMAIFPALGTFFVIQARLENSFLTNNVIFQKIGESSYSIYLWHWPLAVSIYHFSLANYFIYIGITLSIIFGFLSHKYIESFNFSSFYLKFKKQMLHIILLLIIFGSFTSITYGIIPPQLHTSEPSKNIIKINNEQYNKNPRREECMGSSNNIPECIYGEGKLGAIVIGDSHAGSIIRSVEKALPNNMSVLDWTMSGCRTIENIYNIRNKGIPDYSCGKFISYILNKIELYPNIPIIIDTRYSTMLLGPNEPELASRREFVEELITTEKKYTLRTDEYITTMNNAFIDTVCKLSENNPVFIAEQTPEMKINVPKKMAKEFKKGNTDFRVKLKIQEYNQRHLAFQATVAELQNTCNIKIIPIVNNFCDESFCYGDINGRPLYIDDDHLSEYGASILIPTFKNLLTPFLP
ncbi:acyltransferase [Psychromonas sp. psych-6C06]|uniref:acyltransferase family protein n=1 Tax=Psychromonas sp. psych-6C06 TaxID=2058089 RepID=UPI000C34231F|nr:acyltransferase family protein [Psychromonas sp. psych-6C06]PKF60631.1 acyltransferase [Psychromonas sp. psych-6C06]